jgi:sterol desaturase/sphingolipid hydroxylase (fatty acid hydroxylase superfamily)
VREGSTSDGPAGQITIGSPAAKNSLAAEGMVTGLATVAIFIGALTLRSGLVFGVVVLAAVFIPLEKAFALRRQKVFRRGWATDLVHFVVNNLLTTVGVAVAVIVAGSLLRAIVPAGARGAIHHQPGWLQFVEAILVAELGAYWAHRATHRVPFLWRFHKVHHSIEEMDWLASGRLHPVDQAFTRSCAILPIFALGFTRVTFGAFLVFTTFQALFIHANVRFKFGPLRWVISTPEFHHWHHARDPRAYNSNFAGEFPWVDALFGTLHLPRGPMPAEYGTADQHPDGYLRQLAWPFRPTGMQSAPALTGASDQRPKLPISLSEANASSPACQMGSPASP